MKICSKCKIEKSVSEFHKKSASKDGLQSACKECNGYLAKQWQQNNPEAFETIWKRNTYGDEALKKRKARKYGITVGELEKLIDSANGVCQICKNPPRETLVVDHCHKSSNVRGLLCEKCNQGLGLFADDVESLANAIKYLNK